MTNNNNLPKLKPGNESSEYDGKITAQVVLGFIALGNLVLEQIGRESILMDAQTAALAAVALEALWAALRQLNKGAELRCQERVIIEEIKATKETAE